MDDGDDGELVVPATPNLSPMTVLEYQNIFRDIISTHMINQVPCSICQILIDI